MTNATQAIIMELVDLQEDYVHALNLLHEVSAVLESSGEEDLCLNAPIDEAMAVLESKIDDLEEEIAELEQQDEEE